MRVISPFKHKVHNWRIQVILVYKSQPSEFGCFYRDYKYHYCFMTVYQSHLYGHLVLISEPAYEFC